MKLKNIIAPTFGVIVTSSIVLPLVACSGNQEKAFEFTVKFETYGGTEIAPIKVKQFDKIAEPETPVRQYYKFKGWYKEPEFINLFNFKMDQIKGNTTIYAKWEGTGRVEIPDLFSWKPSYKKIGYKIDGYSPIEMQEAYFERIRREKNVLAEDIVQTFKNLAENLYDSASCDVRIRDIDTETGMASLYLELSGKNDTLGIEGTKIMEINNIPFEVRWLNDPEHYYEDHYYVLSKWRTFDEIKDQTGWSLHVKDSVTGEDKWYYPSSEDEDKKTAAAVLATLVVESYYMEDCTKSSTEETTDLLNWKPSGKPIEGTFTQSEMQDEYFGLVDEKPYILTEDITKTFKNLCVKAGYTEAGSSAELINYDSETGMVSIKLTLAGVDASEVGHLKVVEIENIPFHVEWLDDQGHPKFGYAILCNWRELAALKDQTGWSLKIYQNDGGTETSNEYNENSTIENKAVAAEILRKLVVESYYMSKCKQ